MTVGRAQGAALAMLALAGCATIPTPPAGAGELAEVALTSPAGDAPAEVVLRAPHPIAALHFATALGTYRRQDWQLAGSGWRWVPEGDGERLERSDGRPFTEARFTVAQRYRSLIKSYAPFSPFSDGGLLIYSGHYHACLALPCAAASNDAVTMMIAAPGRTIIAGDATAPNRLRFVSRGEGLNIYVGSRKPQIASGMSAIIDPGLPEKLRSALARSLPESLAYFARDYGPLSFEPQLFVSIDARGRGDGRESTQGGTLPRQIFMHFDGAQARQRAEQVEPGWLEWFFAHEVAHMFQRDRTGDRIGDDAHAWMHEGGADAMAALAMLAKGESAYVAQRVDTATEQCRDGLAKGPLTTATQRGDFETHYACGLIATLAVDDALRGRGAGLAQFNRRWFAAISKAEVARPEDWFAAAEASGVALARLRLLRELTGPDPAVAAAALNALSPAAGRSIAKLPAGGAPAGS